MKVLTFQERIDFVNDVIKMCTVEDEYEPALFDVAFRLQAITYFVGADLTGKSQQELVELAVTGFDGIFRDVFHDPVVEQQLGTLKEACEKKIDRMEQEFLTLVTVNKKDPLEDLVDYLKKYLDKAAEQLAKYDPEQVGEMVGEMQKLNRGETALKVVTNPNRKVKNASTGKRASTRKVKKADTPAE